MGKTHLLHSIVLHTHNVGEADRFCILLTKERGRLAARAYGVRKPKSRMGGSLLPLQEVQLTVRESSAGWHIADCQPVDNGDHVPFHTYMHAVQCADILLSLLEDDTPVPDIFALLQQFLCACRQQSVSSTLPFTIQLLCQLGLLPARADHAVFAHISPAEKHFITEALQHNWSYTAPAETDVSQIRLLCAKILEEQSQRQRKSEMVAKGM